MSEDPNLKHLGYVSTPTLEELNLILTGEQIKKFNQGEPVRYTGDRYQQLQGRELTVNETYASDPRWVNCRYKENYSDFGTPKTRERLTTWIKSEELESEADKTRAKSV